VLNFHPLSVTSVERVAEDAACVSVQIPAGLRDAWNAGDRSAFHGWE